MSDQKLPKSRTQLDAESFTRVTSDKIARRVHDETTHSKLDAVITGLGGSVSTTATIYNVSIATANVEQSQAMPANVKGFIIKSRGKSKVQLAFNSGDSGSTFITIPPGAVFEDKNTYSSLTLYFQANIPADIIEIIAYT